MEDEIANNQPADAPETNESDQGDGLAETLALDENDGSSVENAALPEDDSEEVEHEGQKYKIPKALKPALMMHGDYTRKTQEVAEMRKQAEAEITRLTTANNEHMRGVAMLMSIDQQLDAFSKTDWQALSANDPVAAQQAWMQFSQLKDHRHNIAGQLQQAEQQRAFEAQRINAKRIEESQAVLARDIKGWSPDMAKELSTYAVKELGFQPQELAGITDPRVVKLIHQAWTGANLTRKMQPAKPATAPVRPVTQVGGAAPAVRKNPSDMTDAEFAEWRRKQIAQRNTRR